MEFVRESPRMSDESSPKSGAKRHGPNYMKRRSTIWGHFTQHRDRNTAECNYCFRELTYNLKTATTSNLLKHVQNLHHDKISEEEKEKFQQEAKRPRIKNERLATHTHVIEVVDDAGPYSDSEVIEDFIKVEPKAELSQKKAHFLPKPQYKVEFLDSRPQKTEFTAQKPKLTSEVLQAIRRHEQATRERGPGGQIEQINKRLTRIETKLDFLLNFLVGENIENVEIDQEEASMKGDKADPLLAGLESEILEVVEDNGGYQEDEDEEFYQFAKVDSDSEMLELTKKLDFPDYLNSLREHMKEKAGEEMCHLKDLFTERYLMQHSCGWSADKKDIQSNPLYVKVYKYLKSMTISSEKIGEQTKRK